MHALVVALVASAVAGLVPPAAADPVLCQKTIAKQYTVLQKKALKGVAKCLDKENLGTLDGPCPDAATATKLAVARQKVEAKVATLCSIGDAAALGFGSGCGFGPSNEDSAVEASCRALPVTTPAELAACIACWTDADVAEFLALLYASHAYALCAGPPDLASTVCSAGGCSGAPGSAPDQRDLGDTDENECQRAIGKAGVKYLLAREKLLGKCALAGGTRDSCRDDPILEAVSDKAEAKRSAAIDAKCGELQPSPTGGQLTWWGTCERRDCGGYTVTTPEDVDECVEDRADEIVEAMLCYQFPRNGQIDWPCPSSPSGAFVD